MALSYEQMRDCASGNLADLLAHALSFASCLIAQWPREIGRRRPSREMAERLAEVLALPPAERAAFIRAARLPLPAPAIPGAPPPEPYTLPPSPRPPIADALIGRQAEIAAVRAAFFADGQRLVTLLGSGSAGKTRLARHVADMLVPELAGGAAIASLEPVRNVAGLIATVAAAVNLPLSGITDAQSALVGFLSEREMLVVLDTLEHLPGAESGDDVAALLVLLLAAAPGCASLVAVETEPLQAAVLLGATEAIWQLDVTMQHMPNQQTHTADERPAPHARGPRIRRRPNYRAHSYRRAGT